MIPTPHPEHNNPFGLKPLIKPIFLINYSSEITMNRESG